MNLNTLNQWVASAPPAPRQPLLFIGHGSPMNIIHDNEFTRSLHALGQRVEKPAAVLVISAHWLTPGETRVSVNPQPATIHDFGGFPDELYQVRYPAPGHPALARETIAQVTSLKVHDDHEMGLDHGAWSILRHMWPNADVPAFQMSIDYAKSPQFHYDLGRELKALRDKGVLLLGSGNIVHNLRRISWQESDHVPAWAEEFDAWCKARLLSGNHAALVAYHTLGATANLAVPTSDHYLPMLYTLGALDPKETIRFTHESFQNGSISMRCFESAT